MSVYVAKVTMADRAAAERACKDPNPIIDGRKANVNLAYLGAKPRIMQPGEQRLLFPPSLLPTHWRGMIPIVIPSPENTGFLKNYSCVW